MFWGVTPKCFSKANVLFYTAVGGTDLSLSDKCLLTYGMADAVTLAEGTGDTEINSSLFGGKPETFCHVQVSFHKVLFM